MRYLLILIAASLTASTSVSPAATSAAAPQASAWQIGPVIRGRNFSVGMPLSPSPAGRGWSFEFPYPHVGAGHVHYVTFNPGPLQGKSRIVVRYRVDAAPGVRFVSRETPQAPPTVSLVLQRNGDNWKGKGYYEYFRWYAPAQTVRVITPGVHEISVSLNDLRWGSVQGTPAAANPAAFRAALAEAASLGLVFGTSSARGHGVYATGPATFTLIDFRIL